HLPGVGDSIQQLVGDRDDPRLHQRDAARRECLAHECPISAMARRIHPEETRAEIAIYRHLGGEGLCIREDLLHIVVAKYVPHPDLLVIINWTRFAHIPVPGIRIEWIVMDSRMCLHSTLLGRSRAPAQLRVYVTHDK